MHGLGNDFVVIDLISQSVRLHAAHIKRICDRHLGIGCDQLLLIEPPMHKDSDFFYRIYNANGQEVEQCGNGARCAARFFFDSGFILNGNTLRADCLSGTMDFGIEDGDLVSMALGVPIFEPKKIPFIAETEAKLYTLIIEDSPVEVSVLSVGNPHAVIIVPNIEMAPVKKIGALLAKDARFPNQTNVEFMQILDRSNIRLRIWERGVGETLSCGTGACAAAISGIRQGLLDSPVYVQFPYGQLIITWQGNGKPVIMKGPVTNVFLGRFRL